MITKVILTLFLALTLFTPAHAAPTRAEVVEHIRLCALEAGVDPAFAIAVMQVESGLKCGPLGKRGTYIGPGGLHKDFRAKWDIDDPFENIRVAVKALRGSNHLKVLRRYNKTSNRAYEHAVLAKMKELRGKP